MNGDDSSTEGTDATLSRRGFVKTAAAAGVGVAALSAATGTAGATGTRSSYTIMEGTANEQQVHVYEAPTSGPTTMVVAGVHGDETAGYRAAEQIAEWQVASGKLVVVPRAHPSAIANGERPWGSGDLNRHFPPNGGDCLSSLALAIWNEVERHDPDLVFDLHTSRGIYESGDGGVGQAMFPTSTAPARTNGEDVVTALNQEFDLRGETEYRMGNTLDADRDMLVHRVAGVLDRPGYIVEATEKAPLSDQVDWHLFAVEHAMAQFGQERGTASDGSSYDHTLHVEGTGPTVQFAFAVTGEITGVSSTWEDTDDVSTSSATGQVSTEDDTYTFTGDLDGFTVTSGSADDVVVTLDGEAIQPNESTSANDGWFEARTLAVDDPWAAYDLANDYDDPAVFAPALSTVGPQPAHTRVRNVSGGGFEAKVEEWLYQNGLHYEEQTGMLAVEKGTYQLDGGRTIEVGTVDVNHSFESVSFESDFFHTPVVLAQSQTENGTDPIVTRTRNVSSDGFEVRVQEEDGEENGGYHYPETVAYVAMGPGPGAIGDRTLEAGTKTVDHRWARIEFDREYANPTFLADVQSFEGWNCVGVRYRNLTGTSVEVKVEEEKSDDREQWHVDEDVGYVVVEG